MDATDTTYIGVSAVVCLLGLTAVIGGLWTFLRAKYLQRRCTAQVTGTITDIIDVDFGKRRKRSARAAKEADDVVAANEQIAAKKRAYKAKKAREAQAAANAAAATWKPLVTYLVDGRSFEARATRGVPQKQFKVGQTTQVHYDPSRPGRTRWLQLDGLPIGMGITLMICGAVLIGMGVACRFVLPELAAMTS